MAEKYIDKEEQELIEAYEAIDIYKLSPATETEELEIKAGAREFIKRKIN